MKRTLSGTWKALSACALLVASCWAASPDMRVTIPFDFNVRSQHMAAGEYTVKANSSGTLLIQSEDGGSATFALTIATMSRGPQSQPTLVFNRYGNRYFLHQFWKAGSDQGQELTPTQQEREYALKLGKPEIATLVAGAARPAR